MIVDGRAIAKDIIAAARAKLAPLGERVTLRAITMQPNGATESYLRIKAARAEDAGIRMDIVRMPDDSVTEDLLAAIAAPGADSILVQLPLPPSINTELLLDEIPLRKDADVLSSGAYEHFIYRKPGALLPPVVGAIKEVLERTNTPVKGQRVVVVGSGRLVGQPTIAWLEEMGADFSVLTRESSSLEELRSADIIIAGAGSPGLITPDLVKEGVVLIDAGTTESNGSIFGDIDPACAQKARIYTPVPGCIGPISVAYLFLNVAELALRNAQKSVH